MSRRRSFQGMIQQHFPGLRKSQRTTIHALSQGLLHCGRVGSAEVARGMRDDTTVRHRIKRAERSVTNDRIDLLAVFEGLQNWVLSPTCETVVALDWTTLGPFKLLAANVVVARRAVPLAWHVMREGEFSDKTKSRNDAEEQLIGLLRDRLSGDPWILVADRGFARADLFNKLQERDIRYVIRACGNPWVYTSVYEGSLDSFPRGVRRVRRYETAHYHKTTKVPVSMVVTHGEPAPEPW